MDLPLTTKTRRTTRALSHHEISSEWQAFRDHLGEHRNFEDASVTLSALRSLFKGRITSFSVVRGDKQAQGRPVCLLSALRLSHFAQPLIPATVLLGRIQPANRGAEPGKLTRIPRPCAPRLPRS